MNGTKKQPGSAAALADALPALALAFTVALTLALSGCSGTESHMVDGAGEPQPYLGPLWEFVDSSFPGALPDTVTVLLIDRERSEFDEKKNTISISRSFSPEVSRGKVCMALTHLALHRVSGGDSSRPGRCFDDDVRFLEYALASYIDRISGGSLERELPAAYRIAARLFREGTLGAPAIRNWRGFVCKGRWADQFDEWNLDGMQAMLTLGDYLVRERQWEIEELGGVFARLDDDDVSLDAAFEAELGANLTGVLEAWKEYVVERAAASGISGADDSEEGA